MYDKQLFPGGSRKIPRNCYDSAYTCTVRFDQMFGGPFLTLASGSTETHFLVSRTDSFGEAG